MPLNDWFFKRIKYEPQGPGGFGNANAFAFLNKSKFYKPYPGQAKEAKPKHKKYKKYKKYKWAKYFKPTGYKPMSSTWQKKHWAGKFTSKGNIM